MGQRVHCLVLALLVLCGSGCSPFSQRLYSWNAYNQTMADEVVNPEDFNPQAAIQRLRLALESMPTNQIPPGALLHLAFLMEQEGLTAEARALIKRESELFPESSTWVNKLVPESKRRKK